MNSEETQRGFVFSTVAVLGAGLMGAGIVQVSIEKGFNVIMKDVVEQGLVRGQEQIDKNLKKKVKRRRMTR